MDRNSILGILLIAAVLIVWGIIQSPSKVERAAEQQIIDSLSRARDQQLQEPVPLPEEDRTLTEEGMPGAGASKDSTELIGEYGVFAGAAEGEDRIYSIENELIRLEVSAQGGRPYSAELKEYRTFNQEPVILFQGDSNRFGLNFYHQNRPIATNNLFFQSIGSATEKVVTGSTDSLTMRLVVDENSYIEYHYILEPQDYMVDFRIVLVGMQDVIDGSATLLDIDWEINANQQEQLKKNENQYTTIYFRHFQEDVDFLNPRSNKGEQQESIPTQVEWVAFKNQFFSSILIAEESFSNALVRSTLVPEDDEYLKNFRAELGLPYNRAPLETINLKMFYGPNKFNLLRQYGEYELEDLVSVGRNIIRWINQYVIIPIFDWLSRFIGNYGIIILLLTIIIKIALLPLTYRSYLSQARMRVLKPQIDELTKKYPKGKEMERQQATMALYKKAGISPMGGCLPMLLQFPILFAMFRFFPTSIELRQEGFLWAKDLSTYDAILSWDAQIPIISSIYGNHISLFTLLMTVSTILSMKMNDTSGSSQQMPGMKTMMYIMPVMFMFILNNFSAGLTYYYFLANIITIGQNYLFKQFINEKEILRKIEARKAKPVKKSKFQQRLEEMSRQQQQTAKRVPRKK
ncbi:MAG: membrane protein insertase YidC [Bacteroidales bacterium]|nr:membrane protein insertase YidC [Bacteroidales bacterium]